MHSFVGQSSIRELCPPALLLLEGERTEGRKKREVLHLFRCYTHTRPEPGQPWKAKGRKKRTQTTGKGPKQRRGGRGTDGPPKPTYTAKRTWPKQSTHLNPHDTLRRGTQGELGTKWGTSWWKQKEPKQVVTTQNSVPTNLRVVRYSLSGTVVKSCPNWHKRLSSSNELGAQYVSPHQTTIKRKKTTPESRVPACCSYHVLVNLSLWKQELQ